MPNSKTNQRDNSGNRKGWVDPNFWEGQLEERLNEFGASTCDLPEIDPETCKTEKQHEHAVRVRARYLARQIQAIHQGFEGELADQIFKGVMDRAQLIEDGPAWLRIEKMDRKTRGGIPLLANQEAAH
jgi:hypothetical protein